MKLLVLHFIICVFTINKISASDNLTRKERALPGNLISFKPIGKEVSLSMHVDAPFLSIATKKHPFENQQALINFNPAALITSGVVFGSSFLVTFILRKLNQSPREESRESRDIDAINLLDNFSFTVSNSTGIRLETHLARILEIIEQRIYNDQEVNLPVCFQKAVCSIILESKKHNDYENANFGVAQIVNGVLSIDRLQNMLQSTPFINEMLRKDQLSDDFCEITFQNCKLANPISHFWYFLNNSVQVL